MEAMKKQDWWSDHGGQEAQEEGSAAVLANGALQELSEHLNERNKAAQLAQRSSQALFQTLYFKGKEPGDPRCIVEAVVFSIRSNGFLVYVPRYALKGPVYLEQLSGGEHEVLYYDEKLGGPAWTTGGRITVDGDHAAIHVEVEERRRRRQTYRLFDHVTVTIQIKVRQFARPVTKKKGDMAWLKKSGLVSILLLA